MNERTTTGEVVTQSRTATQTGTLSAISVAVDSSFLDQRATSVYAIALIAGKGMSWSACGSSLNPYPAGRASGGSMDGNWELGFSSLIDYQRSPSFRKHTQRRNHFGQVNAEITRRLLSIV